MLADRQGRQISYLRLSVTDKCNFRCSYCSPSSYDGNENLLTRQEIARLVRLFALLGIRRVRLTGGEPTIRKDLVDIAGDIAAIPGIAEVALTTNAYLLDELSEPLRRAGVTHLNISLDTLEPDKLKRISGKHTDLAPVLRGIEVAAGAGFKALKLNTVVMGGVNEDELGNLARFAWQHGASARFIELMPFGEGQPVPTAEVKRLLGAQGVALAPDEGRGWGPAYYMSGESGGASGLVGFISPITENFCDRCNRVRVGADGALRACLGGRDRVPLRDLVRAGADDDALEARIRAALLGKDDRHHMEAPGAKLVLLSMMGIGG